jgi:hypothetical protein
MGFDAVQASSYGGHGRPPVPSYAEPASTLAALALQTGRSALRRVTWPHGTRRDVRNPTAAMTSRFLSLPIRPANRNIPRATDGSLPECQLIAEWPEGCKFAVVSLTSGFLKPCYFMEPQS